ncbi:ras-related protein Rab-43-like isoform X3 [Glandiceps talaboti]
MSSYFPDAMATDHADFFFKIVLVGDTSVGKTSIVQHFESGTFASQRSTIGIDFTVKIVCIGNKTVKLQVWDTAGLDRFRSIARSYYRSANGVFIVYDITKKKTFDNVPRWIEDVTKYTGENVLQMLVGNKSDLTELREVHFSDARALATHHAMLECFETSAKDSTNVEEAFIKMATELTEKHGKCNAFGNTSGNSLNSNQKRGNRGCCS